jgi:hypothetical protein
MIANTVLAERCTFTLSGKILDKQGNSPLDYATVYLVENGKGTMADSAGNYQIEVLFSFILYRLIFLQDSFLVQSTHYIQF